jgi:pimeloyl-ACP methyl ester carboxylesterase
MHVTVDQVDTSFQAIGRQPSTLLLLHGWGNSWEAWAPLIPELSRRYRLLIPDLPGFGRSGSPGHGWNMTQYVEWLAQFLRAQKIDSLTAVLGHSFGGKLAAFGWWSENAPLPPVKKGFFLIDPSGIVNELPPSRRFLRAVAQMIPKKLKRGALAALRQRVYTQVLKETDYLSATKFQEETLNLILREDIRDNAIEADFPLHFAWGEHDPATPVWMAYEFAQLSPESDVFLVPGTGHFPHHEKTGLTLRWLEAHGL